MDLDTRFRWQPIDPGQLARWASLVSAIQAADEDEDIIGTDELGEEFDDPAYDFGRGSVAVYDGDTMIGHNLLAVRSAAEPVHQMRHWGGVHPDYRNAGVGTWLLDWAERAAPPIHHERFPGHRLSLQGSLQARNTAAIALLEAHGYERSRFFRSMRCDVTTPLPVCPVPAGIEIVPFTTERSSDALLIRNESFRDHWGSTTQTEEEWQHFIGYSAFRPAFSFLAYEGAEPVGVVIGHEYDAFTEVKGFREAYIPLVGTRSAARKRGIASALLVTALAAARDDGCVSVALGVDADSPTGAIGVYQRIGFTVYDTWITMIKPMPDA